MKRNLDLAILICGLAMLAAFPVLAQNRGPVDVVRVNKAPFIDLGEIVVYAVENKCVDLTQPFKVGFEGKLKISEKGGVEFVSFDNGEFKWTDLPAGESGNPQLVLIAKSAIEAVNDSGFLAYLHNLGIINIDGMFSQNDQKVALTLKSELHSPERAKTIAFGLNALVMIGARHIVGNDERLILSGFKVSENEKLVIIDFELDKPVVHEMIRKYLETVKTSDFSKTKSGR